MPHGERYRVLMMPQVRVEPYGNALCKAVIAGALSMHGGLSQAGR
jgi:hypothetical protein